MCASYYEKMMGQQSWFFRKCKKLLDDRLSVAWGWGRWELGVTANRYVFFLGGVMKCSGIR